MKPLFALALILTSTASFADAHPDCSSRAESAAKKIYRMNEGKGSKGETTDTTYGPPSTAGETIYRVDFLTKGQGKLAGSYLVTVQYADVASCYIQSVERL